MCAVSVYNDVDAEGYFDTFQRFLHTLAGFYRSGFDSVEYVIQYDKIQNIEKLRNFATDPSFVQPNIV